MQYYQNQNKVIRESKKIMMYSSKENIDDFWKECWQTIGEIWLEN